MGLTGSSSSRLIKTLFSKAKSLENKTFRHEQIEGLPHPAQRYFRYALNDGQSYLSCLRLKHNGQFKTGIGKDWMNINGEQYFTAQPPGFVWIGKTSLFKAVDSYVANKGNLSVFLMGFLRIFSSRGKTIDQAELLRWLGESVWMPTNLLPSQYINWSAIDKNTAKLTLKRQHQSVSYKVYFNEKGQITRLVTERYMNKDRLEQWEGRLNDYQNVNGIKVPHTIEARWLLSEGTHQYAKFHVKQFEYDVPEKFQ